MNLLLNLYLGFGGLLAHKLRAFLTMLGIIFGVAAVIAMLSIGEGARRQAMRQIELMGINNIIIEDDELSGRELIEARAGFSKGLTLQDAEAVREIAPQVFAVVPVRKDEVDIRYGSSKMKVNLIGSHPEYPSAINHYIRRGRFFDYEDVRQVRRVCVIGEAVKKEMFPFSDPLYQEIKIGNTWFTIIGLLESKEVSVKPVSGYKIRDYNNDIIVPLTCSQKFFSRGEVVSPLNQIIVKVEKSSGIRALGDLIERMMTRRHYQQADFKVVIPEELLKQSQSTQRIFNVVMGAIAGISLLVGGIGIMNIMLSSVLERTREVGIRRAVGAKRREIMGQFLIEAVMMSFTGGLLGIFLGVGLAKMINFYAGWITVISAVSVILSFGVAAGVGLIFGFYPARRAALLNPIEALRYE
ncbi:ABC transporter permease [bacterium]|nr:ABC transporter permease [FCB group bacterium]MBL7191737.1 ABC transporter permease [bacterium]